MAMLAQALPGPSSRADVQPAGCVRRTARWLRRLPLKRGIAPGARTPGAIVPGGRNSPLAAAVVTHKIGGVVRGGIAIAARTSGLSPGFGVWMLTYSPLAALSYLSSELSPIGGIVQCAGASGAIVPG